MHHEGHGPVTLADLTSGLIWPRLFRAVRLSIQPSRIMVGFVMVALMMGIGTLFDAINGRVVPAEFLMMIGRMDVAALAATTDGGADMRLGLFQTLLVMMTTGLSRFTFGVLTLNFEEIAMALSIFIVAIPGLVAEHWFAGTILALIWLLIATLGGGAISRMAACEFSKEIHLTAGQGLAFAAARWKDLILAVLAPVLFISFIVLALMLTGAVVFRIPVIDIVGALLYGLMLAAGFVVILLALAFVLGKAMLLPAVAVESTDWLDAIQRSYSYVLGGAIRYLLYGAVLLVIGAVVYAIAALLAGATINGTAALVLNWAGEPARDIAGAVSVFDMAIERSEAGGTLGVAASIIGVWERIVLALLAGFVISFYFSASTLLYLAARRINDEQDMDEIWMPGVIGGTAAPDAAAGAKMDPSNDD